MHILRHNRLSAGFSWIGSLALLSMMVLTVIDVAGRYLLNTPILGAFELTENLVLLVTFAFLGYTQTCKRHISVAVVSDRMPPKVRFVSNLFNRIVALALFMLITGMAALKALELIRTGETSPNLGIPNYPFVLFLALGSLVVCLEFLRDIFALVTQGKQTRS